ncbi:hypothetical protein MBCUT_15680 [Methanobrevibacter cuticularis]|uniref:Uncharacterized protein n=1 Tax=Methanobrevibacter cuticularis TaxID=47311 RepID=A0A166CLS6_9EURY|nr:hypothetical protein MBCUT_15680 [Methanobrevibacter cuticularis]
MNKINQDKKSNNYESPLKQKGKKHINVGKISKKNKMILINKKNKVRENIEKN